MHTTFFDISNYDAVSACSVVEFWLSYVVLDAFSVSMAHPTLVVSNIVPCNLLPEPSSLFSVVFELKLDGEGTSISWDIVRFDGTLSLIEMFYTYGTSLRSKSERFTEGIIEYVYVAIFFNSRGSESDPKSNFTEDIVLEIWVKFLKLPLLFSKMSREK